VISVDLKEALQRKKAKKSVGDIGNVGDIGAVDHFAFGGYLGQKINSVVNKGKTVLGNAGAAIGKENPVSQAQDKFNAATPQPFTNTPFYQQGTQFGANALNQGVGNIQSSIGALGGVSAQQQALASKLQEQANGTGPNPAQAQYQANLNQANQQQAGAVASAKGINPALAARLGAEQAGTNIQAGAATEAATQAQQQLSAQQQLETQQQAIAQTAATQGQLGGTQGNLANAYYGTNVGAIGAQNTATNAAQLGSEAINAGVAGQNTQLASGVIGGLLNAGGGVAGKAISASAAASRGGEAGKDGDPVQNKKVDAKAVNLAKHLMSNGGPVPGKEVVPGNSPKNDIVPTALSAGEGVIPKEDMETPEKAHKFVDALMKRKPRGDTKDHYAKLRSLKAELASVRKGRAA
jgi:hypothetical protein